MDQGIISNRLFGQGYLLWGRRSFIQMDAVPLALRFRELTLDRFIYQCRCNLDFNKTFFCQHCLLFEIYLSSEIFVDFD